MTGPEIAQIILATATLVTALGSVLVSMRNSGKMDQIKANTDGLADQRDAATKKSAFAEGAKSEVDKSEKGRAHDSSP